MDGIRVRKKQRDRKGAVNEVRKSVSPHQGVQGHWATQEDKGCDEPTVSHSRCTCELT